MTTEDGSNASAQLEKLQANLARMEVLTARLVTALAQRKSHDPGLDGPNQEVFTKAAAAWLAGMMQNPAKVVEHQVSYWGKTLQNYVAAQQALLNGEAVTPVVETKDKRFANPLWDTNPAFSYVKQQYLPDEIKDRVFYVPSDNGYEVNIQAYFKKIKGDDSN